MAFSIGSAGLRAGRFFSSASCSAFCRATLTSLLACVTSSLLGACSGGAGADHAPSGPVADVVAPPAGVLDRGADPAVVAIDVGGKGLCAGALIAPDVVLTARSCVAITPAHMQCPSAVPQVLAARDPRSLRFLVGEDAAAQERARGRRVFVPPGDTLCGADIALVLLDAPIDDVRPLSVRPTGAAQGDHVRTVSYGHGDAGSGGGSVEKVVRDHVHVLETDGEEVVLAESACGRALGGPAVDESTSEVLGVSARAVGSDCEGQAVAMLYTRADTFLPLIAEALAQAAVPVKGAPTLRTKKGPVDMGATCGGGVDCAAGVCVTAGDRQYCSRACDAQDRCPARYRCRRSQGGTWVCAQP